MNSLLFYLLQVIAASGLLYGYYHFALRNKKFHRYNRFYLLMAVLISTLIPFLNIPVYFSAQQSESSVMLQTLQVFSSPTYFEEETISTSDNIMVYFSKFSIPVLFDYTCCFPDPDLIFIKQDKVTHQRKYFGAA